MSIHRDLLHSIASLAFRVRKGAQPPDIRASLLT
jgi:hypothetical protein